MRTDYGKVLSLFPDQPRQFLLPAHQDLVFEHVADAVGHPEVDSDALVEIANEYFQHGLS